jgi:hypothetical protein
VKENWHRSERDLRFSRMWIEARAEVRQDWACVLTKALAASSASAAGAGAVVVVAVVVVVVVERSRHDRVRSIVACS